MILQKPIVCLYWHNILLGGRIYFGYTSYITLLHFGMKDTLVYYTAFLWQLAINLITQKIV